MFVPFLNRKIKGELLRLREKDALAFVDYRDAQSVVVLADRVSYASLQPAIAGLKEDGKRVTVVLADPEVKAGESDADVIRLSGRDVVWWNKKPRNTFLQAFLDVPADVILDFTVSDFPPFVYLLLLSPARQKMGLARRSLSPYNFVIQSDVHITPADLAKKILFYWRSIEIKRRNS